MTAIAVRSLLMATFIVTAWILLALAIGWGGRDIAYPVHPQCAPVWVQGCI